MTIRTLLARFLAAHTEQRQASATTNRGTGTGNAAPTGQVDRRDTWRPTARSAYGRHVQAAQFRQTAIEAIHQRGLERGIDAKETIAAMDRLDTELRARGWHPDQFPYNAEDPIDDFGNRVDVDYDPRMAAYDARTARRSNEDGDFA